MKPMFFWTVATVMVVLATLAVLVPLFWVQATTSEKLPRRRLLALLGLSASIPLAALAIYAALGSPELLGGGASLAQAPAAGPPPHAAMAASQPGSTAGGDMLTAIAKLEARLAKTPNDPAGWQLLAQSYDFVGRSADAANARVRAGGGAAAAGPAVAEPALLVGAAAAMAGAGSANGSAIATATGPTAAVSDPLAQTAEQARRARDYPTAVAAFKKLAARGPLSADLWADYADAVGAQRGKLDAASEPMIRQALAIDPDHVKALWLLGSLQTQQGDSRAALASWQKLAQLIAPTSPDSKLIAANIEEARAATSGGQLASSPPSTSSGPVFLSGQVQLDPHLKSRVSTGAVLFIFAKSFDQPGPPLAVFRTTVATWPVKFVLDDSMAMLPNRKLSDFEKITVEARVSKSGSANPSAGDLRGATGVFDPHQATAPLRINIDKEIG